MAIPTEVRDWLDAQITVCDQCGMASCWQGIFMCQESDMAGTVKRKRLDLIRLHREDIEYLKTDKELSG